MLPIAQCVHRLPVRARIRIPSRKRDETFFSVLRERLSRCGQVTGVETNHLTGSALIFYSGDFASIARYAEKEGIFRLADKKHNPNSLTHATVDTYKRLDSQVKRLTGGEIDLPGATWLALVGAGVYQIARGNFTAPAWYTAFWYGLNIFLKAKGKSSSE
ncbi:MAG TPA: hypothetical protein VFG19_14870 [Geobacteraceae bacterium]|nr:hypothetical protein [Geobacteraceae bacterium]